MNRPAKRGKGVIVGKGVRFGENVTVWNYVVIGDGCRIGDNVVIGSFCDIGKNVVIRSGCCIQAHVTISNECVLEEDVFIGPNTTLLNDKYPKSDLITASLIQKGAVIGGCVTILPNLVVGEEAVIGAATAVTGAVPKQSVRVGLPDHEIMSLSEYLDKRCRFTENIACKKKYEPGEEW